MILAIDLGDKRCGIAIEINSIAIPYDIWTRVTLVNNLKKIIKLKNITDIVVGLPYDIFGNKTKQYLKTKKFIDKLILLLPDIKIHSIDERFSSIEADEIIIKGGLKGKYKDDISASIILESFLNTKK